MPRIVCGPARRAGWAIRRIGKWPIRGVYEHWASMPRRERQHRQEQQRLAREEASELLEQLHDNLWSQFPITATVLRQILEEEENDERLQ